MENNRALRELAKVEYQSISHTYNRAVIAAYNNVVRYGCNLTDGFIHIEQARKHRFFLFDDNIMDIPNLQFTPVNGSKTVFGTIKEIKIDSSKDMDIYSERDRWINKSKITEIGYNLDDLFKEPSKEIRRGINFGKRDEVHIIDFDLDRHQKEFEIVYNDWVEMKKSDPKVYQIAFNPARYKRSFQLTQHGYNIKEKLILIKDQPYAMINFAIEGIRSFELAFLSRFKNKDIKLVNDQNECIILNAMHELWQEGKTNVNLGTTAGIKGLNFFKKQFKFEEVNVYTR